MFLDPIHKLNLGNFQHNHLRNGDVHNVLGRLLCNDLLWMDLVVTNSFAEEVSQ